MLNKTAKTVETLIRARYPLIYIVSLIGIVVTFITLTTVRGYKSKQKLKKNIDNYLVEIRKFEKIFSKSNNVGTEYYEKLNSFILNFKIFIEKKSNQGKEEKDTI